MGCDIHPLIEYQPWTPRAGEPPYWWEWARGDLGIPRAYSTFAALAGVRNYEERGLVTPVAEPRGLPADSPLNHDSNVTDCGYHSHSWLTLEEVEEASRRAIEHCNKRPHSACTRSGLEGIIAILRHLKSEGVTARFVFWFDN